MKAVATLGISISESLDIISMDFKNLDKSSGGNQFLLAVIELFTRLTQVYATSHKFV